MQEQRRQFVMGFMAYGVQRGVDAAALCNEAGIDLKSLQQNKDIEITELALQRLWDAAAALTQDPLFGLHLGESFQLAALGAVGQIIKSCATVGEALSIACSYTSVVTTLYTVQVEKNDDHLFVQLTPTREAPVEIARQIADFLMVFTVHELRGFLLRKIAPARMHYPFKVTDEREFQRVLHVPATKDDALKIVFDAGILNEPIITANYEAQHFFLEKMAASQGSANTLSMQARIVDFLTKNAYHGIPSLEDVAGNFNITPRSLQRRLQEEGTTFQQTVDTIRKTLALHYIESRNYNIKQISNLLGYNEISAFSRAFKRWTGKAPMNYSA